MNKKLCPIWQATNKSHLQKKREKDKEEKEDYKKQIYYFSKSVYTTLNDMFNPAIYFMRKKLL